ncbi:MAG: PIN domain-containing protein [Deltaproteobacteria bacterium]|nr:MAG: PIN domain-containing protein [Deltaproteobacteria bacterium]
MSTGAVGYVDTSYLVALAFQERGWQSLRNRLRRMDQVFSSTLLEAEFLSVANREGVTDRALDFLAPISWVVPDRRLTKEILRVLEHGHARGADLHHLATALYLFPSPRGVKFLTLDKAQAALARALGFSAAGASR